MLHAPGRHFLYQRTRQVAGLAQIPESLRPSQFLEEQVRRASDLALMATKLTLPDMLAQKAVKQSKRLNDLRELCSAHTRRSAEVPRSLATQ